MNKLYLTSGLTAVIIILAVMLWPKYHPLLVSSNAPEPTVSANASPSGSPTVTISPHPSRTKLPPITLEQIADMIKHNDGRFYYYLTVPATCALSGSIRFVSHNTAEIRQAKLVYTGIDSPAGQIKWNIVPNDQLQVGPNIAAPLALPNGQYVVSVNLPPQPTAKSYNLTVAMTYSRLVNGRFVPREAKCGGVIPVTLDY